ncbi:hypothetical protein J2X65_004900 [Ancylobacter sp. 3268]|uniref:AAA family ATPase n=1 Tax=Ancylobacter sp. 3268 TaxID=2817752 RepID=UPI002862511A|nr:AAA family ATPase [Ancylobacter sp. 3268]MDR6955520.1 hypothetical protein [Ancylobacter sp. 3268]
MLKEFQLLEQMRSDDPLKAAEAYIAAGLKVVVIHGVDEDSKCTCRKPKCKAFKHPVSEFFSHGAHSATTDMKLVRRAFRKVPNGNLAITLDDLTVIDIDGPEGRQLIADQRFPRTIKVRTPRGSHSHYLGGLSGKTFKLPQADVLTGADRYVLVPPSLGAGGKRYRWATMGPQEAAPLPAGIEQLRRRSPATARAAHTKIFEGARNDTLFKIACSLRRHVDQDMLQSILQEVNRTACETPVPDSEVAALVASAGRYDTESADLFGPPTIRESLPLEFLWYPYIPRHAVTLLAGDPGKGKSLLVAQLIARVTSGRRLPLSGKRASGRRVLLLSAEDNWARVSLPRLEKAGFDIDNLHIMQKFRSLTDERIEAMAAFMREWRPDLVVIDTLSAYMGGARDMHRQNEVGEFLGRLTELAEETGAAILGLAHLNKQSGGMPLYRVVGSIGFMATIRSALFMGNDPDDPERLALAHGKANGSEKGPTILFERVGGGKNEVPILRAVDTSPATDADVCRVERGPVGRPSAERDAAIALVQEMLSDKPVAWETIQAAAEARAIASKSTMNLVRADLAREGKIVQVGRGKAAKWISGDDSRE